VILSLISPTSTSEAPPTLITPTPPFNLASLSYNFSLSYSDVVTVTYYLIYSTLSSINDLFPIPSIIMVSSLVIKTYLHSPKTEVSAFSKVSPISSLITVPPVKTAISFKIAFLLSPKAGAFTAQTFNPPLNLFTIRVAKASLSTSSHINNKALFYFMACSSKWRID